MEQDTTINNTGNDSDPEIQDGNLIATRAWKTWMANPTPDNMSSVVNSIKPVIKKVVSQVPGKSESLMSSEAKRLAISAIKSYDPQHGTSLSTHVYSHLQPIAKGSSRFTEAIHKTRTDRSLIHQYLQGVSDLTENLNREPTDSELMSHLSITPKQLEKMRRSSVGEVNEGEYFSDDSEDKHNPDMLSMWSDHVYSKQTPQSQLIFEYKTGKNGRPALSSSEIANKLGLSEVYVNKKANEMAQEILNGVNSSKSGGR